MADFIGLHVLIIGIILTRALMRNVITRRMQYALWIFVPAFLVLCTFVNLENPLLIVEQELESAAIFWNDEEEDAQRSGTAGIQTDPSAVDEMPNEHAADQAFIQNSALSRPEDLKGSDSAEHMVAGTEGSGNGDRTAITHSTIRTYAAYALEQIDWKLLKQVKNGIAAVIGLALLVYNLIFWLNCRKHRIFMKNDFHSGKNVYFLEHLDVPFLLGNGIYVMPVQEGNELYLEHAIWHEACHAKQGDGFWAVVRYVILVLYWYDPLVWYAAILMKRDQELACDEAVLYALGEAKREEYGKSILGILQNGRHGGYRLSVSTHMHSTKSLIKERIARIAKPVRKQAWAMVFVVLLMVTVTGCALIDPSPADTSAAWQLAGAEIPMESENGEVYVPGKIVNGVYYYSVIPKGQEADIDFAGVYRYEPGNAPERLVGIWDETDYITYTDYRVNGYGVYYVKNTKDRELYVRVHETGETKRLFTADEAANGKFSYVLETDGTICLELARSESAGRQTYELILDGKTGEELERTPVEFATPGRELQQIQLGEWSFSVQKSFPQGKEVYALVDETGASVLPEGAELKNIPDTEALFATGENCLMIEYANKAGIYCQRLFVADGRMYDLVTNWGVTLDKGYPTVYGETLVYIRRDGKLVCRELNTGEEWNLLPSAEKLSGMVTGGEYIYLISEPDWETEPAQTQSCWKLEYEDGRPVGLRLMEEDLRAAAGLLGERKENENKDSAAASEMDRLLETIQDAETVLREKLETEETDPEKMSVATLVELYDSGELERLAQEETIAYFLNIYKNLEKDTVYGVYTTYACIIPWMNRQIQFCITCYGTDGMLEDGTSYEEGEIQGIFLRDMMTKEHCSLYDQGNDMLQEDLTDFLVPPHLNTSYLAYVIHALPEGWRIGEKAYDTTTVTARALLNADGKTVGWVGYRSFYSDMRGKDITNLSKWELFKPLQNASGLFYLSDAEEITREAGLVVAVTAVRYGTSSENANKGILIADQETSMWIALEIEADAITKEGMKKIAEKIKRP